MRINKKVIIAGVVGLAAVLLATRARAGGDTSTLPGGQPDAQGLPPNMRMDYRGSNRPRGIRNNNPGNIKRASNAWTGKVPYTESTDDTFEQFSYYVYGVRAMLKLLSNYIASGTKNIGQIVARWAPSTENNTQAYTAHVVLKTGIPADRTIAFADRQSIKVIAQAMADYENGTTGTIPDEVFDYAYAIV